MGVSGSIFCVIRSAPFFGYTAQGISLFVVQGRDQYMIEGIIVALWTLLCGLSAYCVYSSTKLPISIVRHLAVIAFMTLFVVFGQQLWQAYVAKTMWYKLQSTLPEDLWRYLSSSVKKSSGLMKRLLRVSEVWLFESKTLDDFQKKFQSIVVDYLKRRLSLIGTKS